VKQTLLITKVATVQVQEGRLMSTCTGGSCAAFPDAQMQAATMYHYRYSYSVPLAVFEY